MLADDSKVNKAAIDKLDGVKGCFSNAGQIQVIFGTGLVNKVYAEFVALTGTGTASKAELTDMATAKLNVVQRLARTLSNIFVPIIPAIVASGLLMGLLGMVRTYGWVNADSALFVMLDMFSSAAFIILPILIGFTAAREFGGNPYLGPPWGHPHPPGADQRLGRGRWLQDHGFLRIGCRHDRLSGHSLPCAAGGLVHVPSGEAVAQAHSGRAGSDPHAVSHRHHHRFRGAALHRPGRSGAGDGISFGLSALYEQAGWLAGLVFGGTYSLIVITGIHHSFHAIEAGLLANPQIGVNFLLPIWAMANVAQGGACLAVYFKTRDVKIKAITVPAAMSCLLGITEAAIFGVNLRYIKPFLAGLFGGACGGAYVVAAKVGMTAVGLTGIPGMAIVQPMSLIHYIVGLVIAFGAAFAASYLLKYKVE